MLEYSGWLAMLLRVEEETKLEEVDMRIDDRDRGYVGPRAWVKRTRPGRRFRPEERSVVRAGRMYLVTASMSYASSPEVP